MSVSAWMTMPLLPLRDIVLFPGMSVPLFVGRPGSISAVRSARADGGSLVLVTQRRAGDDAPGRDDLFDVGVLAEISDMLSMSDVTLKVLVAVSGRAAVGEVCPAEPCPSIRCRPLDDGDADLSASAPLMRSTVAAFADHVRSHRAIAPAVAETARGVASPGALADLVAAHLAIPVAVKQEILGATAPADRLRLCLSAMGVDGG